MLNMEISLAHQELRADQQISETGSELLGAFAWWETDHLPIRCVFASAHTRAGGCVCVCVCV